MVIATESAEMEMYLGVTSWVVGFLTAPILVWRKGLSPVMYAAGILGLLGLILVALSPPRCKACRQPLTGEQFRRRVCPTCRRTSRPGTKSA
jgi:hypothetical protein